MRVWRSLPTTISLRRAAFVVFGLTALLPLLLLVSFLSRHDMLTQTEAQVSIFLALLLAFLGFLVFQRMVDRISTLVQALAAPKPDALVAPVEDAKASRIPGLGGVAEIGQMGDVLGRLLFDLRASTERLEDLVFKMGTLNEMVELAARIPDMKDLLALVLERTMRTVRATVGSIMLVDRERRKLRIVAARGVAEEMFAGAELHVGAGIAGTVAQLGEPIMLDDIAGDPRFAKANHPAYGGGSFICLPVRAGDRVIGVINLAKAGYGTLRSPDSLAFSPTDLQFLNALMTYVAYALDNARLLDEALQSAKQLKEVVEDQELRLTVAQKQMLQAEKLESVGRLAAGVAHEVKNPLMTLLTGVKYLSQHVPTHDENVALLLEDMRHAVKRADAVIKGLLDLSAPRELDMTAEDLNPIVEQSLLLVKHELDEAQIRIVKELGENLPVAMLDSFKVQQVLVNIFTNASHAMPDGGTLTVKTFLRPAGAGSKGDGYVGRGDGVVAEVDDTGTGISEDKLKKVFDPFFTTKPTGKGTGLGLSVTRQIVGMHGGWIDIRNRDGGGVRATIMFQLHGEGNGGGEEAHPDR